MARPKNTSVEAKDSSAHLGFEAKLWLAADKLPSIGKDVDDAMVALERDNPRLKGALNKNYGRADLDKHRLGELIDLIGSIQLADVASAEGKNDGKLGDTLLPKLLSGALSVADVQEWVAS